MGKLFAVLIAVITLISTGIFVAHIWSPPPDISLLGPGLDHQLSETLVAAGVLFVVSQLALAIFAWQASDAKTSRPIKTFPGGATPLVVLGITLVGIEVLTLTFVGSKIWSQSTPYGTRARSSAVMSRRRTTAMPMVVRGTRWCAGIPASMSRTTFCASSAPSFSRSSYMDFFRGANLLGWAWGINR